MIAMAGSRKTGPQLPGLRDLERAVASNGRVAARGKTCPDPEGHDD
jgi:hypothetical protein